MVLYWIGLVMGLIIGSVAAVMFCLIAIGKRMKKKELELVKAAENNEINNTMLS